MFYSFIILIQLSQNFQFYLYLIKLFSILTVIIPCLQPWLPMISPSIKIKTVTNLSLSNYTNFYTRFPGSL